MRIMALAAAGGNSGGSAGARTSTMCSLVGVGMTRPSQSLLPG